jgi:hypothetical protein
MRIKEILNEEVTDLVARFYKEASADYDRFYNLEDVKYKEKNAVYYDEYFKKWFKDNETPVFTKPVDKSQPEYTNKPKKEKLQSPGYRGLQYALCAAGLPYDHNVQKYKPNLSQSIASHTMNGARNSNGQ